MLYKNLNNNPSHNFLTFDIEEWYHANYEGLDNSQFAGQDTDLDKNVDVLLGICKKYDVRATCFVLGSVAEKKPDIIRKLFLAGHEIASHGYDHRAVHAMSADEFKSDLKRSCGILEDLTHKKVLGFRAPSWSVKKENLAWYYRVLEELGLKYSSSVYPANTFLYGIPEFPQHISHPEINGRTVRILEIPVPICDIMGMKVGFSGGFYFRLFPAWFIKRQIATKNNDGESVFIYLHPREIDNNQPKMDLSLRDRFIHYWGIRGCERKLDDIINRFSGSYCRISDVIEPSSFAQKGAV